MWSKKGKDHSSEDVVNFLREKIADLEDELRQIKDNGANRQIFVRISELEAEIEELRGINKDSESTVALRDALLRARKTLRQQDHTLRKLTAHPTPYATVVHVFDGAHPKTEPTPEDFVPGVRVRIRRDSEYRRQSSLNGEILHEHDRGWMRVRFENGYENQYRIGYADVENGAVDLEIIDFKPDLKIGEGGVVLNFEGKFIEVDRPLDKKVEPGDMVKINGETLQIIDVVGNLQHGQIAMVVQIVDAHTCEVEHSDGHRIVSMGKFKDQLEKGDRVVLDVHTFVIIGNLGKHDERFKLGTVTNTDWDDIGGLTEAKAVLIEAIELPYQHPELFAHYGLHPPKGILLYGPPGCGKTMLAKAVATSLARTHNHSEVVPTGYLYVKGPELLSKWVGETESAIRRLFARAREHKANHGYPAVLFIDEAESLLRRRGSGISSDVESTIVPMFLAEMDGLDENGAITLLATNRADILDPAVVRNGRIDRKIYVPRPDLVSAQEIFKIHLRGKPFCNGYSIEEVAAMGVNELFAERHGLLEVRLRDGGTRNFTLAQIVNGGMIAGVVQQAVSIALNRDRQARTMTGLKPQDLVEAVVRVHSQNLALDHKDALLEFLGDVSDNVTNIHRLRVGAEAIA